MNTGYPIGGTITIPVGQQPLAKYDAALRQVRPMSPTEQTAFAQAQPKGPAPAGLAIRALDNANLQQSQDPNSAPNVQQTDLQLEHPSAFAALRGGRPGFGKPKRPRR